jgi:hypothetical protein
MFVAAALAVSEARGVGGGGVGGLAGERRTSQQPASQVGGL